MGIKFFGQFLLEKGVITPDQLLDALRFQEAKNLRFGQYATDKGFLSASELDKLQAEQKNTDLRIGELAVKLKMLTEEQVDQLLVMQKNDHVCIGDSLVKTGAIAEDALKAELDAFHVDQKPYAPDDVSVPEGLRNPGAVRDIVDVTVKMIKRLCGVEIKPDYARITREDPPESFAAVSITFSGSYSCDYFLVAAKPAASMLADGIVGIGVNDNSDELLLDAVKEFANIACGNIVARMARSGLNVTLSTPGVAMGVGGRYAVVGGRPAINYQLISPENEMSLWIIEY